MRRLYSRPATRDHHPRLELDHRSIVSATILQKPPLLCKSCDASAKWYEHNMLSPLQSTLNATTLSRGHSACLLERTWLQLKFKWLVAANYQLTPRNSSWEEKKKNTCCFRSGPKTTGRFARQPCENSQLRTPIQKKRSSERSHTSRQRSSLRSPNLENGGCVAPNLWCFEKSGVDTETKHKRIRSQDTHGRTQRERAPTHRDASSKHVWLHHCLLTRLRVLILRLMTKNAVNGRDDDHTPGHSVRELQTHWRTPSETSTSALHYEFYHNTSRAMTSTLTHHRKSRTETVTRIPAPNAHTQTQTKKKKENRRAQILNKIDHKEKDTSTQRRKRKHQA